MRHIDRRRFNSILAGSGWLQPGLPSEPAVLAVNRKCCAFRGTAG